MRHFSCDLCGKDLTPEIETRIVITLEARVVCQEAAVLAAAALSDEDTEDAVEAMDDLLTNKNDDTCHDADMTLSFSSPMSKEFDLCSPCYRRFAADPLGRDRVRRLQFSVN